MTNIETIVLLRSWHNGDRDALEQLVQRHLPWIAEFVRERLGDGLRQQDETMDLVQEAMIDVMTYGPRFELADEQHFRRLLARIVENNIRDRNRFMRRERRDVGRRCPVPSDSVLQLDPAVRPVTRPPEAAERNERREWIRLAIELLDPLDRAVIRLREFERLSFEEIAERLDAKPNTVRMRFERALPKLVGKLGALRAGAVADELG